MSDRWRVWLVCLGSLACERQGGPPAYDSGPVVQPDGGGPVADDAASQAPSNGDAGAVAASAAGPGLCSPEGWCWASPLPHGFTIRAYAARSPTEVWAVGEHGFVARSDGRTWTTIPSPTGRTLHGVWVGPHGDVWIVGAGSTVLRWRADRLEAVPGVSAATVPATPIGDVFWVWGTDERNVFVSGGDVRHWNGTRWTVSLARNTVMPLRGARDGTLHAWGYGTGLLRFDGHAWVAVPFDWPARTGPLNSVMQIVDVMASGGDLWVLGAELVQMMGSGAGFWVGRTIILRRSDGHWSVSDDRAGALPNGRLLGEQLTVAAGNTMLRFDGARWSSAAAPTGTLVSDLAGRVLRVDRWGAVAPWDGPSAPADTPASGDSVAPANDVWVRGPGDIWAAGGASGHTDVRHFDGTTWTSRLSRPGPELTAIRGTARTLWAVGPGILLRGDGERFQEVQRDQSDLRSEALDKGLAVFGEDDVWATWFRGSVIRWDGRDARMVPVAANHTVGAIWGAQPDDLWISAVEHGDTVDQARMFHWDGRSFSRVALPRVGTYPVGSVRALWGTGPSNVWAAASDIGQRQAGLLLHWDGKAWSVVHRTDGEQTFVAVWGTSASDVWALGMRGHFAHFDGQRWTGSRVWSRMSDWSTSWNTGWSPAAGIAWAMSDAGQVLTVRR